jgi:hypothetical protein
LLTVVRLDDSRVLEGNSIHSVIAATTHAANGQTVTTRAVTAAEGDVLERNLAILLPKCPFAVRAALQFQS